MIKKTLLALIPLTLALQGSFIMTKGKPLIKAEQTYTSTQHEARTNTPNQETTVSTDTSENVSFQVTNNTDDSRIQLRMPNTIKVLQGDNLNIYLENIVNVKDMSTIKFAFYLNNKLQTSYQGTLGKGQYILLKPSLGVSKLEVKVSIGNKVVANATSKISTLAKYTTEKSIKILTIGDSFTDGSDILKPLKSILDSLNYPASFIGTQHDAGINHEGRGGWTAAGYMNLNPKWYPNSPFLNGNNIDFKHYFNNKLNDKADVIIIELGVNDILGATKGITKGYFTSDIIHKKIQDINLIVENIRNIYPSNPKILMMMPTPPNNTYNGVVDGVDVSRYKSLLRKYYKLYLSKFENREAEGIYIAPAYLSIDTWNEFDNFVHPNLKGYKQIAKTLAAEILWLGSKN